MRRETTGEAGADTLSRREARTQWADRGRQGNENRMTKQARTQGAGDDDRRTTRRHNDKQRDKETTTTPPTPSPQTETDAPQTSYNPPPQGVGDERTGKSKHGKPADAIHARHGKQSRRRHTIHMTREALKRPRTRKNAPAPFSPAHRRKTPASTAMTPQPRRDEQRGRGARTRRRGEPRKGSRQHRRKCP